MQPQTISFIIVLALFGVLGLTIGHRFGLELGSRASSSKQYWALNIVVIVTGILLSFLASAFQMLALIGLVVCLIAGAITGLKNGWGKSEGIWKAHDKAFLVNKEHRKRTKEEEEALERGETIKRDPDVELISVENKDTHHKKG